MTRKYLIRIQEDRTTFWHLKPGGDLLSSARFLAERAQTSVLADLRRKSTSADLIPTSTVRNKVCVCVCACMCVCVRVCVCVLAALALKLHCHCKPNKIAKFSLNCAAMNSFVNHPDLSLLRSEASKVTCQRRGRAPVLRVGAGYHHDGR